MANLMCTLAAKGHDEVVGGEIWSTVAMELRWSSSDESGRTR